MNGKKDENQLLEEFIFNKMPFDVDCYLFSVRRNDGKSAFRCHLKME